MLSNDPQGNLVWTLANALQYGLPDRLKELGRSTLAHRALTSVAAWFAQLLPLVSQGTLMQRERGVIFNQLGDALMQVQGDLVGALQAYRSGWEISMRMAQADVMNTEWLRDLSVSHEKIGDVLLAQGDLVEALTEYLAGLKISERFAQVEMVVDATNASRQRDLSVSYNKIGNVLRAQRDLTNALLMYQAGLEIRERLVQFDVGNTVWQRDLSVGHDLVASVFLTQGDLKRALSEYGAGQKIRVRLVQTDPMNARLKRDLCVSNVNLALTHEQQGEVLVALEQAVAGLDIAESLSKLDPNNATWRGDLAACRKLVDRLEALRVNTP